MAGAQVGNNTGGANKPDGPSSGTDWSTHPDGTHNPASDDGYTPPPPDQQHPPYGGYWSPVHGGGWGWHAGSPPDSLVKSYGWDKITDAKKTPDGADNPNWDPDPAPTDVKSPELSQPWSINPPNMTGDPLQPPDGNAPPQVGAPPHHPAYHVSPGDIRFIEATILGSTSTAISDYEKVKAQVEASKGWHWEWGTETHLDVGGKINSIQDNMLLAVGDALHLAGEYVFALNQAGQYYVRADKDSVLPEPDAVSGAPVTQTSASEHP